MVETRSDGHNEAGQDILPMPCPAVNASAPNAGVGPITATGHSVVMAKDTMRKAFASARARCDVIVLNRPITLNTIQRWDRHVKTYTSCSLSDRRANAPLFKRGEGKLDIESAVTEVATPPGGGSPSPVSSRRTIAPNSFRVTFTHRSP